MCEQWVTTPVHEGHGLPDVFISAFNVGVNAFCDYRLQLGKVFRRQPMPTLPTFAK